MTTYHIWWVLYIHEQIIVFTNQLVQSRIDMMLANNEWFTKWTSAHVEQFRGGTSDHLSLIMRLRGDIGKSSF